MHTLDSLSLGPSPSDFDAAMLDEWKLSLLAKCLPAAMRHLPPEDTQAVEICRLFLDSADRAILLRAAGTLHQVAEAQASRLLGLGDPAATLTWARCAYVAGRAINHAWLDFFDILRACGGVTMVDSAECFGAPEPALPIPLRLVQYRPEDSYAGRLDERISWCQENGGANYRAFNDDTARTDVLGGMGERTCAAYTQAPTTSRKATIFFLSRLLRHGGIYAGGNEVCNASLDVLIPPASGFVMPWSFGRPSVVWPQFMATRPANPVVARLLKHVVRGSEWMAATGTSIDEWMIYGAGGFTMTILDAWCEGGTWPHQAELHLLGQAYYRTVVEQSERDRKVYTEYQPELPPKVPAIPIIRIDSIIKPEDSVLQARGGESQRVRMVLPSRVLPPGRELTVISTDPAHRSWQDQQAKPALAPAAAIYWLHDLNLSGHGCLWKGNRFIRLNSYLSDVAEGETRGGAWQTPWTHKTVRVVEEPVVVAFSPGYSCYGHWLVDELPRLGLLKLALGDAFQSIRFVFPEKLRSWGKALLKFFFNIEDDRILYFDHEREMWHLNSAIVPGFLHKTYQFQPFVRDFFSAYAPTDAIPHRKVCLSRRDWDESKPDQRIFTQREQFERMAADRGFDIVAPEELSLADQVRLMAETAVQIGEHGSAQHGSVFSRHSTIVGSINPLTGVQVNLGRIADDRNVLLFAERMSREPSGSLRFDCSEESLRQFFQSIEHLERDLPTQPAEAVRVLAHAAA